MRYSRFLIICLLAGLLIQPTGARGDLYPIGANRADVDDDQISTQQAPSPYQLAATRSNSSSTLQIELNGMPLRMQLADWRRRVSPPTPPSRRAAVVGNGLLVPLGIGAGVVLLGFVGWWMRRYT